LVSNGLKYVADFVTSRFIYSFSKWMIRNDARTKRHDHSYMRFFLHVVHETNRMRTNLWDVKRLYNGGLEVCKEPYCVWQVCVGTVTQYKGKFEDLKSTIGRLLQPTFPAYVIKYLRFLWKELRDHFQKNVFWSSWHKRIMEPEKQTRPRMDMNCTVVTKVRGCCQNRKRTDVMALVVFDMKTATGQIPLQQL
jgi:hypothetical protein